MSELRSQIINPLCRLIIAYEWLWLLLILPFVVFPTPARSLVLFILPLLWLARKVAVGHFVPPTPVNAALLALLLMVLVSLFATYDPAFSFVKVAGLLYGLAVFYMTVSMFGNSRSRLWLGVWILLAAGWIIAPLGILGGAWMNGLPRNMLVFPGVSHAVNPNEVAGVLLWMTPLAIVLAGAGVVKKRDDSWQPLIVILLLATAVTFSVIIFLTQSRSSFLGLGAGLIFVFLVGSYRVSRPLFFVSLIIIAVVMVAGIIIGGEQISAVLFELPDAGTGLDETFSLESRLEIWSRAIYGIQDFPITGMGMNNFRRVVHILYPLFLVAPDRDIAHAHNHLLQTALDLGLPGLVAYLALWFVIAGMLWQTWHSTLTIRLRVLCLGFSASLLAYFVYGFTDAVALGARPGFIFWFLLGLIASLHARVMKEE